MFTDDISVEDWDDIRKILLSSGYFYDFEVDIVYEILEESVKKGQKESGYYWIKMTEGGKLAGFSVFGPNPSSVVAWDLYWIAVDNSKRNKHFGTKLIKETEENACKYGAKSLWIETSGRDLYKPTVCFYLNNNYEQSALLKDFYDVNDDKIILKKNL